MYIFSWFFILAAVTLIINLYLLHHMKQTHTIRLMPILCVTLGGYLIAAGLYVIAAAHGTQVLSQTLAASFSIDTDSFTSEKKDGQTHYSFYCDNGISFAFDDSRLLKGSSDASVQIPDTVDVYSANVRTGYSWCYLRKGSDVYYLFRQKSF